MKLFKEFLLDDKNIAEQTIYLPQGAEAVGIRMTDKGLMLYVIIGYEATAPELRTFKICVNGENFIANTVKYIGNFESSLGIKHVIEIIKEY